MIPQVGSAVIDLFIALGLSAVIGLEREWRQKSAGMRTHTLVGVGSALFMIVSKYGFFDVLSSEVVLDPSRIAAQIVSGIGFIGGGVIFVRRDVVRGLTTAATIWVAAGVGAAAGADLRVIAVVVTAIYLIIALGFVPLSRALPRSRFAFSTLRVTYEDGRGLLRSIVRRCTTKGYFVAGLELERSGTRRANRVAGRGTERDVGEVAHDGDAAETASQQLSRHVVVLIELEGKNDPGELVGELAAIEGIYGVSIAEGGGSE